MIVTPDPKLLIRLRDLMSHLNILFDSYYISVFENYVGKGIQYSINFDSESFICKRANITDSSTFTEYINIKWYVHTFALK